MLVVHTSYYYTTTVPATVPLTLHHTPLHTTTPTMVMLVGGLGILYTTHSLLEGMNMGVVMMVTILATHSLVICTRALYGSNLYLELVWLLAPTIIVVVLIVRTVCMQCSDEDIAYWCTASYS